MRLVIGRFVAILLVAGSSSSVDAYLKLGTPVDGRVVDVTWRAPVRYFVSDADAGSVSANDLRGAVSRASATWQAVPSATVAV